MIFNLMFVPYWLWFYGSLNATHYILTGEMP
jgi:hypothetical protein